MKILLNIIITYIYICMSRNKMKNKNTTLLEQFQNLINKNTTLLEQFQNLINKNTTLLEQFQNLIEKYHTVGTVPKSMVSTRSLKT